MFKPLSPALNAHLEEAVERFRQHRKEVDKEAEVCHMIEEKEARDLVLRNNAAAEAREREAKQKSLISQLSKVDYEYKHRQMQRLRHSGSGSWLVELPEFKNWMNMSSSAVFCCYGIPGCGKSVLISSIIDGQLSRQADSQISPAIAFYYCNYADKRTLDPLNLFGSIAQQLLRKLNDLPPPLSAMLENLFQDGKRPEVEDMIHLIRSSVEALSSVVMFIDGLDEMSESERKLVFSHLQIVKGLGPTSCLKMFVSSREDTSYLMVSYGAPIFKTLVSTTTISEDIESYTKSEIQILKRKGDLVLGDPALEDEIVTALVDGAKGMFLWVKFQLDDLCAAETDKAIRDVLRHLPRSLSETYDRLLGRIEGPDRRAYVKRMFNWILCATRPLHVNELREAIAFTIDDTHWDASKIPNDMARLVRACGNLVLIDEFTQNVQFAHYTVAQYLLGQEGFQSTSFHIERKDAEFQIGLTCVAYLSFSDFDTQLTQYANVVNPSLKILEHAAKTQSLLPLNTPAGRVAKAVGKIRGRQQPPSDIDFARHATVHHNSLSSKPLFEKFLLLSYIAKNWLIHTHGFVYEDEDTTSFPHFPRTVQYPRHVSLFDTLAFDKKLLFDFRPWGELGKVSWEESGKVLSRVGGSTFPLVEVTGWGLFSNHVPLLQAINRRAVFCNFNNRVRDHVHIATLSYLEKVPERPPMSLDSKLFLTELSFQPITDRDGWELWLYRNLTHGFRHAGLDAEGNLLKCSFPNNVVAQESNAEYLTSMYSYLLVDSVRLGNVSAVRKICAYFNSQPKAPIWFLSECHGSQCNPWEIAALKGFSDIMHLLKTVGCPILASFRKKVTDNRNLLLAVEAGDIDLVKCLVVALSDAWLSQPRDEININGIPISRALKCLRMEQAQQEFVSGDSLQRGGYNLDSDATDCGMQEAIDLLITDGSLQLSTPEISLLLWDAILEDRTERVQNLIDQGVSPLHMVRVWSRGMFNAGIAGGINFEPVTEPMGVNTIPALCWAFLNERHESAEILLVAGALLEDTDLHYGYTSLFCAVSTGSLRSVKLLHKYGANIKARDVFGRNILEFANFCFGILTGAFIRYIIDQDRNYWVPIANRVFDSPSWSLNELQPYHHA